MPKDTIISVLKEMKAQAEAHMVEARGWHEANEARDARLIEIEQARLENDREHCRIMQEQNERAVQHQERLVDHHIKMLAQVPPERVALHIVKAGEEPAPMSLEEYESSAKEP